MAYPFLWKPSHIVATSPSQVTIFDTVGDIATLSTGVSVAVDGTITFSLVNYGKYTVKVRDNLSLEMATFVTASSGTSTPNFTMYEYSVASGTTYFSDAITTVDLQNPTSEARTILDGLYTVGSNATLPSGGIALQIVRRNAANTGNEWVSLTKALVGLSNVDNTSDAQKPISDQTAIALSGKAASTHTHTSSQISDATATGKAILTAASAADVKTLLGSTVSLNDLPAGSNLIISKVAGVWPARPTTRSDIVVTWVGPIPDPTIVSSPATNGMYENDIRMVTSV